MKLWNGEVDLSVLMTWTFHRGASDGRECPWEHGWNQSPQSDIEQLASTEKQVGMACDPDSRIVSVPSNFNRLDRIGVLPDQRS
jgi:hypothetical protein